MKTVKLRIPGVALLAALAMVVLFSFGSMSEAALQAVSPTLDPVNGFPIWYQDTNGLQLELCTDPVNCIVTPVIPTIPFSVTVGFGDEMFYFIADALMDVGPQVAGGPTGPAKFRAALEGAFNGTTALMAPGEQIVFTRLNLQAIRPPNPALCTAANLSGCVLAPSTTYTVTHPYGAFTFTTDANGGTAFVRSEDLGGCVVAGFPCDFAIFLPTPTTNFGPFLTAVAPPAPAGFIGNGLIDQTVTGSPLGTNFFRIDGPNAGGPGIDFVQTSLFNLAGQVAAFNLDVTLAGNGTGTVTSTPAGIDCGIACNAPFAPISLVTLTFAPSATSVFYGHPDRL